MPINHTLFVPIFLFAILFFCYSCYRRLQLVALGQPEDRFDRPGERLAAMLTYAFGQKRVLARPFGVNHFVLFWAFLFLLGANGEFLLEGLHPALTLAQLPTPLHHGLGFIFDAVSLLALVCVGVALARRLFFPPDYLGTDYTSPRSGEGLLILGMIAVLMIAFFVLHGALIALHGPEPWRPLSALTGNSLAGLSAASLEGVAVAAWWVHAIVLLVFMNLLPRSKHMHILTAIPNTYLTTLGKPNTQPRETFEKGERFGAGEVERLSWKDLLDSLTCTECGRCQDLCPAHNTGKALNPRRIVHNIKVNLMDNGAALKVPGAPRKPLIVEGEVEGAASEEAIWDCTTCGACLEACPVLIEQMPKIVKMRRYLVQEQARFPEELLNLFENTEQRSNPWGIAPGERAKWCDPFGERPFESGQTEYLFFVGCAGAFDNRSKHVTAAVAMILDAAGISWGILGKDELCCGDSLRRLGNEYVFDRLAEQNVTLFQKRGVKKIITQCPHCFSTLKNDYRQYGLEVEVVHHSELIQSLLADGRLRLEGTAPQGKLLFHDSCYLGRHNDTYAAPREALTAATGKEPGEFVRNSEKGFCCGAGGGRMWMEELTGTRINLERVKEALQEQPDTVCVACPYCMTMLEDGLKDEGAENVRVKDVAEVVAEALE
ncbi:MAG: electron transfer flavoprotein [Desulfuromonas sp.]|uniref:(Fe-S)-binding protein n=1 Tax=Desulfuromonas sp. TaxID=892 RepID=UPI000CB30702|nr:(Fe-S)-binding protein [Desulfuromonas sp.]PLX83650.1 MAG: electron transfer flavoprotein [Desulfuromonas sp.]